MYTTEHDIAYDSPKHEIYEIAEKHHCTVTLLQQYGPAGGNPLYRFSSHSLTNLQNLENEFFY